MSEAGSNATTAPARLALTIAVLLLPALARAQTVTFVFVAPSATVDASFAGQGTAGGAIPAGYKGVTITAANAAQFNTVAPPRIAHLYTQLQSGTALRNEVNQVFAISGNRVDVKFYLVDDRTGLAGDTGAMTPFTVGGTTYVWPAASVSPSAGGRYQGEVGMGEKAGDVIVANRPGGIVSWEATALHETSHTQWVGAWTKWGAINQRAITYGADGAHYEEELLGDQNAAVDEGQGTFFGHVHNFAERQEKVDFFKRADYRYFVEARSVLAGERELYSVAARQQGTVGGASVFRYRWMDVPGFYLLFSESTSSAFYTFFWLVTNSNRDQAFNMLIQTGASMWTDRLKRHLTYACNRLALQLEAQAATPAGQQAKTAGTLTSSMFPFALLDVLTHFGMSDQEFRADYDRHYPDRQPRAYTEYWNRRQAVRQLAQPHLSASPILIVEAVNAVHRYFQQADTILVPSP